MFYKWKIFILGHPQTPAASQRCVNSEIFVAFKESFTIKALIAHTKQLLLVTFCDTTAGIWVIFRTDGRRTHGQTGGRTDRRGSRNSYLDFTECRVSESHRTNCQPFSKPKYFGLLLDFKFPPFQRANFRQTTTYLCRFEILRNYLPYHRKSRKFKSGLVEANPLKTVC